MFKTPNQYNERCRRIASQIRALTCEDDCALTVREIIQWADESSLYRSERPDFSGEDILVELLGKAKVGRPMPWMI